MKKPKHLAQYSDDYFQDNFLSGYNKLAFGFAEVGEAVKGNGYHIEFVGNYGVMKEANEAAKESGGFVKSYLFGKLKRGWVVMKNI